MDKNASARLTSDGSLRFFALVTPLNLPPETFPDVLPLDEPEPGLPPVGGMMKAPSARRQAIVATQSPLLVDAFGLDEILAPELRDKGRTTVRRFEDENYRDWLKIIRRVSFGKRTCLETVRDPPRNIRGGPDRRRIRQARRSCARIAPFDGEGGRSLLRRGTRPKKIASRHPGRRRRSGPCRRVPPAGGRARIRENGFRTREGQDRLAAPAAAGIPFLPSPDANCLTGRVVTGGEAMN